MGAREIKFDSDKSQNGRLAEFCSQDFALAVKEPERRILAHSLNTSSKISTEEATVAAISQSFNERLVVENRSPARGQWITII